jgi:hypothetical protein
MKHLLIAAVALAFVTVACSDDSTTPTTNNVSVYGTVASPTVVAAVQRPSDKLDGSAEFADRVVVTKVKVLVSRMIMHRAGSGDTTQDKTVKTEPFVYEADSTGTRLVVSALVPEGNYDKVKFEMHRFSSSELPAYSGNAAFADFTTSERFTVVLEGLVTVGGSTQAFTFKSDPTANNTCEFTPALAVAADSTTSFSLDFDALWVFRDGNDRILNPLHPDNANEIRNRARDAFKAKKK